jgi:acyl-lipid Delta6-acetylenase / acyl-lipid (9-3)-desaturase
MVASFYQAPLALLLSLGVRTTASFQGTRHTGGNIPTTRPRSHLQSAVVNGDSSIATVVTPTTTWDCDADAQCVVVPACDDTSCRTSLDVRVHQVWYDLSGWRRAHPAGAHWIDWYDGRDATEVMDGFHSEKGRAMYQRLPKTKAQTAQLLEATTVPDSSTQLAFRQLRAELEQEGWWKRDMVHEGTQLGIWSALVVGAAVLAHTTTAGGGPPLLLLLSQFLSTCLLSLSMTAAGWLGHDYIHGVDAFADRLRNFAAIAAGLNPTWWSDKHNKHHALTNEQGVDEDIATDPFLYAYVPDPSQDSPLRKIQHLIFWVPFSFLFALWRLDSVKVAVEAVERKRPNAKAELYCLLAHYAVLFTVFPLPVWLPAIFVSGLVSALIVTPTHQSEQLFDEYQPDWVTAQFQSTRNAVTTNPFSEWIWGGMQYQLEHQYVCVCVFVRALVSSHVSCVYMETGCRKRLSFSRVCMSLSLVLFMIVLQFVSQHAS